MLAAVISIKKDALTILVRMDYFFGVVLLEVFALVEDLALAVRLGLAGLEAGF